MPDNLDIINYAAMQIDGNVAFYLWGPEQDPRADPPLVSFSAPPAVMRRITGTIERACVEADAAMPTITLSPLELPMRSEVQ